MPIGSREGSASRPGRCIGWCAITWLGPAGGAALQAAALAAAGHAAAAATHRSKAAAATGAAAAGLTATKRDARVVGAAGGSVTAIRNWHPTAVAGALLPQRPIIRPYGAGTAMLAVSWDPRCSSMPPRLRQRRGSRHGGRSSALQCPLPVPPHAARCSQVIQFQLRRRQTRFEEVKGELSPGAGFCASCQGLFTLLLRLKAGVGACLGVLEALWQAMALTV